MSAGCSRASGDAPGACVGVTLRLGFAPDVGSPLHQFLLQWQVSEPRARAGCSGPCAGRRCRRQERGQGVGAAWFCRACPCPVRPTPQCATHALWDYPAASDDSLPSLRRTRSLRPGGQSSDTHTTPSRRRCQPTSSPRRPRPRRARCAPTPRPPRRYTAHADRHRWPQWPAKTLTEP